MTAEEIDFFETEGIRYYSNVMTTFTASLKKAIEKAKTLEINTIAPGHGRFIERIHKLWMTILDIPIC